MLIQVLAAVVLGAGRQLAVAPDTADFAEAELDVFATVMSTSHQQFGPRQLVLHDANAFWLEHRFYGLGVYTRPMSPDTAVEPDSATIASFRTRNLDSGRIVFPSGWAPGIPRWGDRSDEQLEVARRECRARWGAYCLELYFSHVGFSHDGRRALVFVEYTCGGLCGSGAYLVLERDRRRSWRIIKTEGVWIS